jgi:hypothetical protein
MNMPPYRDFTSKNQNVISLFRRLRFLPWVFDSSAYDRLTGSGHSHQAVCYQYLTPNGVRQNPLDFLSISSGSTSASLPDVDLVRLRAFA